MWQSIELHFASDHPTASGHFPSNPIIPGALLLDEVVKAVARKADSDGTVTIRAAKFFQPVRPGDSMHVQWRPLADGAFKFECHLIGRDGLAAVGTVEIGRIPQ